MKTSTNTLIGFILVTGLISCSPGNFSSQTEPTTSSNQGSSTPPANDQQNQIRREELRSIIADTNMTGFVSGGGAYTNQSTPAIDFNKKLGVFIIRTYLPFTSLVLDAAFRDYPGMKLYTEYINNVLFLTVEVPAKYVLKNIPEVRARLPNGDRVPLFPAGEPPSKGILLTPDKDRKVYLYLSGEAFGLFVETSFNPLPDTGPIQINELIFPIKNKEETKIMGYLTAIGRKSNFNGGIFVSYKIDPKIGRVLEEYYLN